MVQEERLKQECFEKLEVVDGVLYWKATGKKAGYEGESGYIQVGIGYKTYLAHRLIYLMTFGHLPELIDHIDRNPRNNLPSNLREADKKINAINTGLAKNNKSGVKGVSWYKKGKKWTAQIRNNGLKIHLGSYSNLNDAIEARLKAEGDLWNDFR